MPFVYVINSQSGQGQMSDGNGKFTIVADDKDSIIFCIVWCLFFNKFEAFSY